jgi:hypothetical protein
MTQVAVHGRDRELLQLHLAPSAQGQRALPAQRRCHSAKVMKTRCAACLRSCNARRPPEQVVLRSARRHETFSLRDLSVQPCHRHREHFHRRITTWLRSCGIARGAIPGDCHGKGAMHDALAASRCRASSRRGPPRLHTGGSGRTHLRPGSRPPREGCPGLRRIRAVPGQRVRLRRAWLRRRCATAADRRVRLRR